MALPLPTMSIISKLKKKGAPVPPEVSPGKPALNIAGMPQIKPLLSANTNKMPGGPGGLRYDVDRGKESTRGWLDVAGNVKEVKRIEKMLYPVAPVEEVAIPPVPGYYGPQAASRIGTRRRRGSIALSSGGTNTQKTALGV